MFRCISCAPVLINNQLCPSRQIFHHPRWVSSGRRRFRAQLFVFIGNRLTLRSNSDASFQPSFGRLQILMSVTTRRSRITSRALHYKTIKSFVNTLLTVNASTTNAFCVIVNSIWSRFATICFGSQMLKRNLAAPSAERLKAKNQ